MTRTYLILISAVVSAVCFVIAQEKPMTMSDKKCPYRIVDFTQINGVPCPCGTSRRGLIDEPNFPGTIHRTDIDATAKAHYHKKLTEVYYVISCEKGAYMELDGKHIPLRDDMAFYIPPYVVHRLVGKAKTFITVLPKFDPTDEYFPEKSAGDAD